MKKLLFTVLVVIVALGGAYADIYPEGSATRFPCMPGELTCALEYGNINVFNVPYPNTQGQPQQGDAGTQEEMIYYSMEE